MSVGALIAVQLKHAGGCSIFHFHAFCLMFSTYRQFLAQVELGKLKLRHSEFYLIATS